MCMQVRRRGRRVPPAGEVRWRLVRRITLVQAPATAAATVASRGSGKPVIRLVRGGAKVRTFEVVSPSRTSDSAMVTAAATPSTTGTPVRSRTLASSSAMPPQPRQITSAWSWVTAIDACSTIASTARSGWVSSSSTAIPLARTEAQRALQPRQLQPVLDQRHRPVERGHHRVLVAQEHRGRGGGLGDVHHRHVQQLLQALAAVLAVAGLDHRVEGRVVAHHRVHDADGGTGSSRSCPRPTRRRNAGSGRRSRCRGRRPCGPGRRCPRSSTGWC